MGMRLRSVAATPCRIENRSRTSRMAFCTKLSGPTESEGSSHSKAHSPGVSRNSSVSNNPIATMSVASSW